MLCWAIVLCPLPSGNMNQRQLDANRALQRWPWQQERGLQEAHLQSQQSWQGKPKRKRNLSLGTLMAVWESADCQCSPWSFMDCFNLPVDTHMSVNGQDSTGVQSRCKWDGRCQKNPGHYGQFFLEREILDIYYPRMCFWRNLAFEAVCF